MSRNLKDGKQYMFRMEWPDGTEDGAVSWLTGTYVEEADMFAVRTPQGDALFPLSMIQDLAKERGGSLEMYEIGGTKSPMATDEAIP